MNKNRRFASLSKDELKTLYKKDKSQNFMRNIEAYAAEIFPIEVIKQFPKERFLQLISFSSTKMINKKDLKNARKHDFSLQYTKEKENIRKEMTNQNVSNPNKAILFIFAKQLFIDSLKRKNIALIRNTPTGYEKITKGVNYFGKTRYDRETLINNNPVAAFGDILTSENIDFHTLVSGAFKFGKNNAWGWSMINSRNKINVYREFWDFFKMFEIFEFTYCSKLAFNGNPHKFKNFLMECFHKQKYDKILVKPDSKLELLLEDPHGLIRTKKIDDNERNKNPKKNLNGYITFWNWIKFNYEKWSKFSIDSPKIVKIYRQFTAMLIEKKTDVIPSDSFQWRRFLQIRPQEINSNTANLRREISILLWAMNIEEYLVTGTESADYHEINRLIQPNTKSLFKPDILSYLRSCAFFLNYFNPFHSKNIFFIFDYSRAQWLSDYKKSFESKAISFYDNEIAVMNGMNEDCRKFFGDEKYGFQMMDNAINYIFNSCKMFNKRENKKWKRSTKSGWILRYPNSIYDMLQLSKKHISWIKSIYFLQEKHDFNRYFQRGLYYFMAPTLKDVSPYQIDNLKSTNPFNFNIDRICTDLERGIKRLKSKFQVSRISSISYRSKGERTLFENIFNKFGHKVEIIDKNNPKNYRTIILIEPKYQLRIKKILSENQIYSIHPAPLDVRIKGLDTPIDCSFNKKLKNWESLVGGSILTGLKRYISDYFFRRKKENPLEDWIWSNIIGYNIYTDCQKKKLVKDLFRANNLPLSSKKEPLRSPGKAEYIIPLNQKIKNSNKSLKNRKYLPRSQSNNPLKHDLYLFGVFWERSTYRHTRYYGDFGRTLEYVKDKIQSIKMGYVRGRSMGIICPNIKIINGYDLQGKSKIISLREYYIKELNKSGVLCPVITEEVLNLLLEMDILMVNIILTKFSEKFDYSIAQQIVSHFKTIDLFIEKNSILKAVKFATFSDNYTKYNALKYCKKKFHSMNLEYAINELAKKEKYSGNYLNSFIKQISQFFHQYHKNYSPKFVINKEIERIQNFQHLFDYSTLLKENNLKFIISFQIQNQFPKICENAGKKPYLAIWQTGSKEGTIVLHEKKGKYGSYYFISEGEYEKMGAGNHTIGSEYQFLKSINLNNQDYKQYIQDIKREFGIFEKLWAVQFARKYNNIINNYLQNHIRKYNNH